MTLLSKLPAAGRVDGLYLGSSREAGLEKSALGQIGLRFHGIEGDCHAGLTRSSDSRTLRQYARGTEIRNVRQVTLVSDEELRDIAEALGVARLAPEWLGANMLVSGITALTLLPPSSRLQFPSGATLVVDMENAPCRQVAEIVERHHPGAGARFVKVATHRRGLTAWVEREGGVSAGDAITVWIPPQRLYPPA